MNGDGKGSFPKSLLPNSMLMKSDDERKVLNKLAAV